MERQPHEVQPAFIHTTIRVSDTEMQRLKTTELVFEQDIPLFNWIVSRFRAMGLGEFRHNVIETRTEIESNPIFPMREHEERIVQMEREGTDEEWEAVWQTMKATKDAMREAVLERAPDSLTGSDLESDFWIAQDQFRSHTEEQQRQSRPSLDWEMDSWIAGGSGE